MISRKEVSIPIGDSEIGAYLTAPDGMRGIVVFAHGSGSSRHSSRNQYVAGVLHDARLATLLLDLLTPGEAALDEQTRQYRFDIPLLSQRLTAGVDWVLRRPECKDLPVGLFGASTGAAAALITAADRKGVVKAVVSRGGRPDLAGPMLAHVDASTLLIVGAEDQQVLLLNRQAQAAMHAPCRIEIVPGASHLFEEPGTLQQAALLACQFFVNEFVDRS